MGDKLSKWHCKKRLITNDDIARAEEMFVFVTSFLSFGFGNNISHKQWKETGKKAACFTRDETKKEANTTYEYTDEPKLSAKSNAWRERKKHALRSD